MQLTLMTDSSATATFSDLAIKSRLICNPLDASSALSDLCRCGNLDCPSGSFCSLPMSDGVGQCRPQCANTNGSFINTFDCHCANTDCTSGYTCTQNPLNTKGQCVCAINDGCCTGKETVCDAKPTAGIIVAAVFGSLIAVALLVYLFIQFNGSLAIFGGSSATGGAVTDASVTKGQDVDNKIDLEENKEVVQPKIEDVPQGTQGTDGIQGTQGTQGNNQSNQKPEDNKEETKDVKEVKKKKNKGSFVEKNKAKSSFVEKNKPVDKVEEVTK